MTGAFRLQEATIEQIHGAMAAPANSPRPTSFAATSPRIDAYDRGAAALNAVPATSERALAGDELDRAFAGTGVLAAGPLHGIPIALKDHIPTVDPPTSFGSIAMDGYRPRQDATVTGRLRDAGAIIPAKTSLPGWATPWFSYSSKSGDTRNPYDRDRDPGGCRDRREPCARSAWAGTAGDRCATEHRVTGQREPQLTHHRPTPRRRRRPPHPERRFSAGSRSSASWRGLDIRRLQGGRVADGSSSVICPWRARAYEPDRARCFADRRRFTAGARRKRGWCYRS